jgi:hypothetical protein
MELEALQIHESRYRCLLDGTYETLRRHWAAAWTSPPHSTRELSQPRPPPGVRLDHSSTEFHQADSLLREMQKLHCVPSSAEKIAVLPPDPSRHSAVDLDRALQEIKRQDLPRYAL